MNQTFRAICPATKELHVFELVREGGKMVGWCTRCRTTWPLTQLTDGKTGEDTIAPPAKPKKKR